MSTRKCRSCYWWNHKDNVCEMKYFKCCRLDPEKPIRIKIVKRREHNEN